MTEPVRLYLVPIALAAFIAAAQAFIDGKDTRGIITAVLGALILVAQELARSKVVPEAKVVPAPEAGADAYKLK